MWRFREGDTNVLDAWLFLTVLMEQARWERKMNIKPEKYYSASYAVMIGGVVAGVLLYGAAHCLSNVLYPLEEIRSAAAGGSLDESFEGFLAARNLVQAIGEGCFSVSWAVSRLALLAALFFGWHSGETSFKRLGWGVLVMAGGVGLCLLLFWAADREAWGNYLYPARFLLPHGLICLALLFGLTLINRRRCKKGR